jgi:hypothetical protein
MVIPAFKRGRQEDHKFEASLVYTEEPYLKKKNQNQNQNQFLM